MMNKRLNSVNLASRTTNFEVLYFTQLCKHTKKIGCKTANTIITIKK